MAISGADATRPVSQATRVGAARSGRSAAREEREQGTVAVRGGTVEHTAPRVGPAAPRRVRLPEITPHEIEFRHDRELNRVIVEVVDPETGKVLRTIPPEEIVRMLKSIREAHGRLLDEEA